MIRNTVYECTSFGESEFVIESLHWHNLIRFKHSVSALALSPELCEMAQFWANHLAHTDTFYHRNLDNIGENLFSKWTVIPEMDPNGNIYLA